VGGGVRSLHRGEGLRRNRTGGNKLQAIELSAQKKKRDKQEITAPRENIYLGTEREKTIHGSEADSPLKKVPRGEGRGRAQKNRSPQATSEKGVCTSEMGERVEKDTGKRRPCIELLKKKRRGNQSSSMLEEEKIGIITFSSPRRRKKGEQSLTLEKGGRRGPTGRGKAVWTGGREPRAGQLLFTLLSKESWT